jgi:hypothetical protein
VSDKDKKIIEEAVITSSEPVFILRAKDLLSTLTLMHYMTLLEAYVPYHDIVGDVAVRLEEFRKWQQEHPHDIRLPD